ncbi:hypothetical protein FGK63_12955 [Ruegeria sediminis]|uniref:TIGR03016 family PEP-CTERM system-associated outer membrane protein n=1 Tax=Ruegeria sediminis TaxID=2583820 RepID=A0ABY2WW81_9RHOB|nr:hypothetical protein [Ruegeria sediminis]TMV07018.1 hypothetical protein FGK63_12955 [Ruegeria sediminis]
MGKNKKKLSLALAGGAASIIAVAPAIGQQYPTQVPAQVASGQQLTAPQVLGQQPQVPGQQSAGQQSSDQQSSGQQSSGDLTTLQQTPGQQASAQLIQNPVVRQLAQNPARRLARPGLLQTGVGRGPSVTLDYLSTFRYDDNLRLTDPSLGSTTRWENILGLGVVNQTPNSTLTFDLSGLFRIYDEPVLGSDTEFVDPFTRFSYQRDSANSQFGAALEYRETDLNFSRSLTDINLDGIIDSSDITTSAGIRTATFGNLDWQTGINDPLGFQFGYFHRERDYRDTTDPNLFNNRTDNFSVAALMRYSPVLQGNVRLSYEEFKAEDTVQTDRNTTTLSTGVSYDVSSVTTVNADIGIRQVDETFRALNTNSVTEDYVALFTWSKALPDGTANAVLDHTFGVNGSRTSATVGRSYQRANGSLDFNVGLTEGPFGETTWIGDLGLLYSLNTSQFAARLQRRVGTSTQSRETRQTLAYLAYDYFINPISAVSFSLDFADQEDEGPGAANPRQRANFTAAYTRAITNDWAMSFGYQHQFDDQGGTTASGNSVYFTLGRQFTLKP